MGPERNQPCPCGSGEKYKKCCLQKNSLVTQEDFFWRRLSKERDELIKLKFRFAREYYIPTAMDEAWKELCFSEEMLQEGFDPESHLNQIFFPWFFCKWIPDENYLSDLAKASMVERTIDESILNEWPQKLTPLQRLYVEKCSDSPFSFYDVIESKPNKGLKIRNILISEELDVVEKSGSKILKKGDIIFGMPLTIEGLTVFEALSPITIPPERKIRIIELRKLINTRSPVKSSSDLISYDTTLCSIYMRLYKQITNPKVPEIHNTDDEEMIFQDIFYNVSDSHEVFERLHKLDIFQSKEELLEEAVYDEKSRVKEVKFSWYKKGNKKHKSWANTVLGHFELKSDTLKVFVNSKERAAKIKLLIERLAGDYVTFRHSVIRNANSLLNQPQKKEDSLKLQKDREELMQLPEVQEKIKEMLTDHWNNWLTTKLPALGNRSPKQAARSKEGRELLEPLFIDIERKNTDSTNNPVDCSEIFKKLKSQLGLENQSEI